MNGNGDGRDPARFESRLDDLSARFERAEERNEYVGRLTFQKLDEIEHQFAYVQSLLSRLGAQIEAEHANLRTQWERFEESLSTHDRMLRGRNGHAGLLLRTDRIEQHVTASRWTIRAVIVALLTLGGTVAAEWLVNIER